MSPSDAPLPSRRDLRVDLIRGAALLMIFVDHLPANSLGNLTLRNFGFADAAELFVIFAGFSATIAYGRVFARDGLKAGLYKVFGRCAKLYGVQVALLLATFAVVKVWTLTYNYESIIMGPLLRDGVHGAVRGLMLEALPAYLDILPLYLVLIAVFPLVYFGFRVSRFATILVSLAIYAAANVLHVNLVNTVDTSQVSEWFFNPFAWQLIFVLGAALADWTVRFGRLPRVPLLVGLCWAYLAFALVVAAPWQLWSNTIGDVLPLAVFGNNPKAYLTPWRLLQALAIVYLALTSTGFDRLAASPWVKPIVRCGRHSLEVFALGSLLALFGRLAFKTVGMGWNVQLIVNFIGISAMILLADLRDGRPYVGECLKAIRQAMSARPLPKPQPVENH